MKNVSYGEMYILLEDHKIPHKLYIQMIHMVHMIVQCNKPGIAYLNPREVMYRGAWNVGYKTCTKSL